MLASGLNFLSLQPGNFSHQIITSCRKSEILPRLCGGCCLHAANSFCAFAGVCCWNIKGSPTFKWPSPLKSDLKNLTTSFILPLMHNQLHQRVLMHLEFLAISFIAFKSYPRKRSFTKNVKSPWAWLGGWSMIWSGSYQEDLFGKR